MFLIYALFVISSELLVIMLCMLLNVLPGKWYRWRIVPVQMFLSTLIFTVGGLEYIFLKTYANQYGQESGLLRESVYSKIFILYVMMFLFSAYRYFQYMKGRQKVKGFNAYIELKKEEYKIVKQLNYILEGLIYYPNVSAYAVVGTKTIIFSGPRPTSEIDAGFICRKIGNEVYECLSYIEKGKITFKSILHKVHSFCVISMFALLPFLFVYVDYGLRERKDFGDLYNLCTFFLLFLFGSLGCKIFNDIKGFGKILYVLCSIVLVCSFYYLIIFLR